LKNNAYIHHVNNDKKQRKIK